jgi:hypothetical protein
VVDVIRPPADQHRGGVRLEFALCRHDRRSAPRRTAANAMSLPGRA